MNTLLSRISESRLLSSFFSREKEEIGDFPTQKIQSAKREDVSRLLTGTQKATSIKKAQEIMGEKLFCGPRIIEKFWGIKTSKIPPVPYSESMLERAKNQNMSLQYFPPEVGSQVSAYELEHMVSRHVARLFPHGMPNGSNYPLKIERGELAKTQEEDTLEQALRERQNFSSGWRLVQSGDIGRGASMEEQTQSLSDFEENLLHREEKPLVRVMGETTSEAYFRMNNQLLMGLPIAATITESKVTGRFGPPVIATITKSDVTGRTHIATEGRPNKSYALGMCLTGEGVMGGGDPTIGIGAVDKTTHQYIGANGHSYRSGDTWPKTVVIR